MSGGLRDRHGLSVSTASPTALTGSEQALWRMLTFYDPPLDDLDAAIAADPAWALPRAMKAAFLLGLTEPSLVAEARATLAPAIALAEAGNEREQAHVDAVQALADGDWARAGARWGGVSHRHPRDALALHCGHLFAFHRGDASALLQRVEAALPAWSADDAWRPHVVAMRAFGLEEQGRYAEAEAAGRESLAAEARTPWAIHAVAHVMEMQGRHDEGRRWLAEHRAAWGEDNGFSAHVGWHEALFALEALDVETALAVVDRYLDPALFEITLQRLDSAALLWRLGLLGVDVKERWRALLANWPLDHAAAGHSTFNDLHIVLGLLGSGDLGAARAWVEAATLGARRGGAWNRTVMDDVGAGLLRALLDFGAARFAAAAAGLAASIGAAASIGGSHAQRDVLEQTLLAASLAAAANDRDDGPAPRRSQRPPPDAPPRPCAPTSTATFAADLVRARLARKPTPLSRWWADRFAQAASTPASTAPGGRRRVSRRTPFRRRRAGRA